ncbi:hypothetical protein MHJ97_12460 [Macrococcus epidermidis]|uniref:hypothetical protein n=1 Tax=Macrococcus epidermidis TaxID=1902580 RepID=UPI001EF3274D|nr:hypothetical protein [Macrococcus epidermidis]MCG7421219.1 hypothetical protein [Macrococcus epidermidis]
MKYDKIKIKYSLFFYFKSLYSSNISELSKKLEFIVEKFDSEYNYIVSQGNFYETELIENTYFYDLKLSNNKFFEIQDIMKKIMRNEKYLDNFQQNFIYDYLSSYQTGNVENNDFPFLVLDFKETYDKPQILNIENYDHKFEGLRRIYLSAYIDRCNALDKLLLNKKIPGYRLDTKDESLMAHIHFKYNSDEYAINLIDKYFLNYKVWKHGPKRKKVVIPKEIINSLDERFLIPGEIDDVE